ncbi:hypothetical protein [Variovorax sp. E3]|uniref:hypothetical protein n=1 Tax=Variovorax sp. E3 TaxID=1914993 RepID=UPI0018DD78AE|nr:hypothetical protein [Variovorax sp. E3]
MKPFPFAVRAGDVLRSSPFHVYVAPFGILSLAVWGLWCIALCAPVIGWIRKRELMVEQVAGWNGATWAAIVGVPLGVLACQVLLRLWLRGRRIEVFADRVRIRGALADSEVPIQGVIAVTQHYDMRALSSSLRLRYHAETRVRKISGWLISSRELEALGSYIVARNRALQPTMHGELH